MKKLVIDALIFQDKKSYGYQEFLTNLLSYFIKDSQQVSFDKCIIICDHSQIHFFNEFTYVFEVIGFPVKTKLKHLLYQNLIAKKLQLTKDDIILYTYNYSPLLKQKCKNVLVIHDLLYLRKHYLPNFLMRLQRHLFIPHAIKVADKIIAISEFTKNDIKMHFAVNPEKLLVIYNYFNFKKYTKKVNSELPVSFFERMSPYFLSVCSTAYHKNTLTVIKAFEHFCWKNNNFFLILVGALSDNESQVSSYYNTLPEKIKNKIVILSNISNFDLGKLYRQTSLFISLTLFEGLGMPIVEAMYFNSPLLLSNLEVCREISSNFASFCNPFDIEEIVATMIKLISEHKKQRTHKMVLQRFSSQNTSQQYINLLNSL